jgi:hypothetical protein
MCSKLSQSIQDDVRDVAERVQDLQSRAISKERRELIEWLSPLNFWSKQSDVFSRRLDRTGEWFLQHEEFNSWFRGPPKTLWCRGIRMISALCHRVIVSLIDCLPAGAGKTVLA